MICVPISRNSRGSSALTLPCVPTDMKTGVSMTPWGVVNRPSRALEVASVFNNSNIAREVQPGRAGVQLLNENELAGRGRRRSRTNSPGRDAGAPGSGFDGFQGQVHLGSLASCLDLESA